MNTIKTGFIKDFWEESWTYIKTAVDVVHDPILILDKELRVMAANGSFYKTFQVEPKDTEKRIVYELGNSQWDIPALRKLLENILPKNTFFKGFEVAHDFPVIGQRTMILNARQIFFKEDSNSELFPPIILLVIEDVTEIMQVADAFTGQTKQLEAKLEEQTQKLEICIKKLEQKIEELKNKP